MLGQDSCRERLQDMACIAQAAPYRSGQANGCTVDDVFLFISSSSPLDRVSHAIGCSALCARRTTTVVAIPDSGIINDE